MQPKADTGKSPMTAIQPTENVAKIVLEHPGAARVMQRFGIDFCCRGETPLETVCKDQSLNQAEVVAALEAVIADRSGGTDIDPRTLSTLALIGRIVDRHHSYLRTALPFVVGLAQKVHRVHASHTPWLKELEEIVIDLKADLDPHLDFEEQELFPSLLSPSAKDKAAPDFSNIQEEHLAVGELLRRMRVLTDGFVAPSQACGSWRTLYAELEALEGDILVHVHMENHVLMPRFAQA
jgi:regulator of cell morphogenesis and NO signaling